MQRIDDQEHSIGFLREFLEFVRYRKKWWLLPLLVVFLMMGALAVVAGSPVAPLIYPFF